MRWPIVLMLMIVGFSQAASGAPQPLQELRVRWDGYDAVPPTNVFTLLQRRTLSGSLPRQRNPELSEDQIVIEAVNGEGEQIDAQIILDPRVLRAEAPGPTGTISGQVLQHASPRELLIALPDDPDITELRVYHPRWNGSTFVLDLLGTIPLLIP